MRLAQSGQMLRPDNAAAIRRAKLDHVTGTPVTHSATLRVGVRNALGRVAACAEDPSAHLPGLHIVRHREPASPGIERRRLLAIADEDHVGLARLPRSPVRADQYTPFPTSLAFAQRMRPSIRSSEVSRSL